MRSLNIKPRLEYFFLGLRDKIGTPFKPEEEVRKLNLKEGQKILDYGCGIGSYTFPAANLIGEKGKVYALDKQPLAIKKIEEKAQREGFHNINTILSDGDTGLPDESVDVILLYGVLPEIKNKETLLRELYRVLKPNGYLSTRFCFRMKKDRILETMDEANLFSLRKQKGHILNFSRKSQLPKLAEKEVPLSSLPLGREGIITRILNSNAHRRILTLGLLPGTPIKAISRAPLGDPIVFQVRGHRLALRGAVAKTIFVNILSKEV